MAEMFSRHYQLERIQAGSNIYPKIEINLKDDSMWGLKIQIKNNSYPVQVYRMIIYEDRNHLDIKLKPKSEYIQIRQGETKYILPGELSRQALYAFRASIRIYLFLHDCHHTKGSYGIKDLKSAGIHGLAPEFCNP